MPLAPGTKLGPYEIGEQIGAGGMGEVYKANDPRLGRAVAIKVLPAEFTQNAERRQRLEREARAISSLSHPNICTLYDVGRAPGEAGSDGTDYLVMEYLEGESLADRLAKGPMPIEQVLRHGREIADALDKAHRQGIVHRDLKPGNVVLTKTGAKLLDFGLAAVRAPVQAGGSATALPTMTAPLTGEGTILGTFQYMAPEQLEGQEADQRTDIFALGALLYEMATARKAFAGKSQASLISSIMSSQPAPISSVQPMTPPALDRVIQTCMAKDPENRWQTAHDVALQLAWIAEGGSQAGLPAPVAARRRGRERTAWIVAAAAALVATAFAVGFFARAPREARQFKFDIAAPRAVASIGSPRISPDGRVIAFDATDSLGRTMIWTRPLDALVAQPLAGTEGTGRPFWSPDSRYLGFFAGGKLKKVEISGAPPQTICDAPSGFDGSWSPRGVILFDGGANDSLMQVSATGGVATAATAIDRSRGEIGHGWPEFLPDGNHFLFLAWGSQNDQTTIKWGRLGQTASTAIGPGESRLEYAPPGYLVFSREGTLMAQPFDTGARKLTGEPFPVSDQVGFTGSGLAHLSVSDEGTLIYRSGGEILNQLVWFDRGGRRIGALGSAGDYFNHQLSPDGRYVVFRVREPGDTRDVWIIELERGVTTRLTFDPANDNFPIWSPDGREIVFSTARLGPGDLYRKPASGAAEEESLLVTPNFKAATDWTRDGRYIIYQEFSGESRNDLYALPMNGERRPIPLLKTRFHETHGKVSPDGRWLAYVSNESGRPEVYVRSFPGLEGRWQVSSDGGMEPHWRADGKELIYIARDRAFMSVKVDAAGDRFVVSRPEMLFEETVLGGGLNDRRYDMTRDGQRFLLNCPVGRELLAPTTVVVNWAAGLKR